MSRVMAQPGVDLQLPDIEEDANFGSRVARGAVGVTLASVASLLGLVAVLLFTVHLDVTLDTAGRLEPQQVHAVRSPLSGVVGEILVATGERVQGGQVVARLDAFELETELAQLHLEADLKRHRPDTLRQDFQLLEQQIDLAEQHLARHVLRSPGAGTVLSEELHDLVGSRAVEGDLLLEVGSATLWHAELWAPEQDIHLIKVGDPVKFEVRAITTLEQWRHRVFEGQVTYVGSDETADKEGYYRVLAGLDLEVDRGAGDDVVQRFRRGMSVEARIITRSARAVDLLIRFFTHQIGG